MCEVQQHRDQLGPILIVRLSREEALSLIVRLATQIGAHHRPEIVERVEAEYRELDGCRGLLTVEVAG